MQRTYWYTIPIEFAVINGELEVDMTSELAGDPIEAFQRIYLIRGDTREVISDLADLAGKVIIKNPAAALSFVRLSTSPATFYLTRFLSKKTVKAGYPGGIEVMAREKLTERCVFGDTQLLQTLRSSKLIDGFSGVVGENVLRRLGIKTATSVTSGSGFLVHHTILRRIAVGNRSALRLVERTDRVTMDGRVTSQEKVLPASLMHSAHWSIPEFL